MQKVLFFDSEGRSIGSGRFTNGVCRVTPNRIKKAGSRISVKTSVPILDLHGFFIPDRIEPSMKLDWVIAYTGAAQRNYPLVSFFNQAQENRATLFLDNLMDDFEFQAKMNQEHCCYDVTFTIAIRSETRSFRLYCDAENGNWTHAVNRALLTLRSGSIPAFPEAAYKPVYCTWYAVHAALNMPYLEANAKMAADLGFGTFIVDDGWCIEAMKRVSPETIGTWYDCIGDWRVIGRKLPKFADHVKRAQAMGLKYLLWVSPFFAGSRSKFYDEIKDKSAFLTPLHEGYRIFDPADPVPSAASYKRLLGTMKKYQLDGLKIDFVDAVPQSVAEPRGREVYRYMKRLVGAMRKLNPEALIEFRQRYNTPQMLDFGTQFRAGDVPFDFLANLHRVAQIRVILGDHVPVHADPVYWHDDESAVNVARHMIASCAGVPMLSMDLRTLGALHQQVVRHYLEFYAQHLETFAHGHWEVRYNFNSVGYLSVEKESEKIIILLEDSLLDQACGNFKGTIHVMNLSNAELSGRNCFGPAGEKASAIVLGGHGEHK